MEPPNTIPFLLGLVVLVGGIILPLGLVVAKNINAFKRDGYRRR